MTSKQFRHTIVAASVVVAVVILLFSMGLIPSVHFGSKGAGQSRSRTLAVAAAADLETSMDEIVTEFQRQHPDIDVQITIGSSGNFYAQLVNHAPFDVFLSADTDYPSRLIEQELAPAESKFTYAVGHAVLWVPLASRVDATTVSAATFVDGAVRKIAIANPRYAPYGRAAEAALRNLGVYEKVRDKIVYGDNVAQTAQFIQSGAADIGIISKSQALGLGDSGRFWEIPRKDYPRIDQGGVVLSWARDQAAAQSFRAFMIGKEGQALLRRHGFSPPEE